MKASIPIRHHYVPRLLIRNFANGDGAAWTCSRAAAKAGVRLASPEDIFLERHLYTATSEAGEKDVALEKALAEIEAAVAPVIVKIVEETRAGRAFVLSHDERRRWNDFFIAQTKRTPDFTSLARFEEEYAKALAPIVDDIAAQVGASPADRDKYFAEANSPRVRQNVKVLALSRPTGDQVSKFVGRAYVSSALVTARGKSLVLGSHPVTKLPRYGVTRHRLSETWIAVAPDVAVCVSEHPPSHPIVFQLGDADVVREFNVATCRVSSGLCAVSEPLLWSLAKAEGWGLHGG